MLQLADFVIPWLNSLGDFNPWLKFLGNFHPWLIFLGNFLRLIHPVSSWVAVQLSQWLKASPSESNQGKKEPALMQDQIMHPGAKHLPAKSDSIF